MSGYATRQHSMNIILVGPMGSGKSAVGRQLARRLRRPFVDSDTEIERRTGADIPLIFEKEGETGFRLREREVLTGLAGLTDIVLATGGGAVLLEENRRLLSAGGFVVYLETSVAQQVARVRDGEHRPLLAGGGDMTARLAALMAQRESLYREVSAITVCTDGRRVREVVDDIVRQLPQD